MMIKFKKALSVFLSLTLALTILTLPITITAASSFTKRNDFIFGVNGHNRSYKSYPERTLESQIKLAAELGVKMYRFNFNPVSENDFVYMDEVVNLADRYGMEIMLVCDGIDGTTKSISENYKTISSRYNGKNGHGLIRYIQIYNEVDIACMKGAPVAADGTKPNHFNQSTLDAFLPKMKSASQGVKAGNNATKVVINISYKHYYFLEFLKANGVEWDITGLDWYKNMEWNESNKTSFSNILTPLMNKFSQDIIVCETNIWPDKESLESSYENDVEYLPSIMNELYNNYPRVKGVIFYELLDEPAYELKEGKYSGESHFGLIKVSKNDFSIGAKKPIYKKLQQLLGGGTVTPKPDNTISTPSNSSSSNISSNTSSHSSGLDSHSQNSTQTSQEASILSSSGETLTSTDSGNISLESSSNVTPAVNEKKGGGFLWLYILLGIAILLVIAIGTFFLLKYKFGMFNKHKDENDE